MRSVSELCEVLAMSTEDNFAGFRFAEFVAALFALLQRDHNPDLMGAFDDFSC
jgi:hypothetical protein